MSGPTLRKAIAEQVDMANSHLDTDEWSGYNQVGRESASHATINHSENQYLDPHTGATTNEVEGYFSHSSDHWTAPTTTSAPSACHDTWPGSTSGSPPPRSTTPSVWLGSWAGRQGADQLNE